MARSLEAWEENNYFCSWLIRETWEIEVLESLSRQFKEYCIRKDRPYTVDGLENALYRAIEELSHAVDGFIDDEFAEEDFDSEEEDDG